MHKGKRKHCVDMATTLPMPHESVLVVYDDGKEKTEGCQYNAVAVKLPIMSSPLHGRGKRIWD